jgi:hypothetical protein
LQAQHLFMPLGKQDLPVPVYGFTQIEHLLRICNPT